MTRNEITSTRNWYTLFRVNNTEKKKVCCPNNTQHPDLEQWITVQRRSYRNEWHRTMSVRKLQLLEQLETWSWGRRTTTQDMGDTGHDPVCTMCDDDDTGGVELLCCDKCPPGVSSTLCPATRQSLLFRSDL